MSGCFVVFKCKLDNFHMISVQNSSRIDQGLYKMTGQLYNFDYILDQKASHQHLKKNDDTDQD